MKNWVKYKVLMFIFLGLSMPVLGLDKDERAAISAIKSGNIESLRSYLGKRTDVNCRFSNGKTGLYYAIEYEQFRVSKFLLERGADPDLIVDRHSTLKWAVQYGRTRIARLLIEYGADVDKADSQGYTPLIYAAELNNIAMCKILIDRGADPWHTNLEGKRASDFAVYYQGSPAYDYLLLMEERHRDQEPLPSMKDGPYISREADDLVVMTYYERRQDENLTRVIEKTVETGKEDTIVEGIGWDRNTYRIRQDFVPNPDEIKTTGDIFVIGDIHGRYDALVNLLMNNKIIDSDLKWVFGEGQLVLLGDVFDRGASVTETLWFLYHLQIQALKSGGNVHLLLGNHEVMALTGDHRYLDEKYRFFTQYTLTEYFIFFEKNTVLGRWLRSQNILVRINDYLFMHAGISPQFAIYDFDYSEINFRVRQYLNSDYSIEKGSPEDLILGPLGPQWYRGYKEQSDGYPEVTQGFVDGYLNVKGLKRMIVGHNEQREIISSYGGKVISADVAIDESGGSAQGLLISGDRIFRCLANGTREEIE